MNPKDLIQVARNKREQGDLNEALSLFLKIDKLTLSESQMYDYLGELGLTYLHLKDYENAGRIFEIGLDNSQKDNENSYKAVFQRHLYKGEMGFDLKDIIINLIDARELAKESGRKDLVWFDQGILSAIIKNHSDKEQIMKWSKIASKDLYDTYKSVPDDLAIWVWVTGILIEKYKYDNDEANLYIALIIADKFSLKIRKEQISSLLNV